MRTVRLLEKAKGGIRSVARKLAVKDRSAYTEEKVYCPPEKDISHRSEILGILFRGAVVFCALFGIVFMLYDSFGIYKGQIEYTDDSFSFMYMIGICFLFTVVATATPINRATRLIFPLGTAAVFAGFAFARGNPFTLIENSLRYLWNAFTAGAAESGYLGMLDAAASAKYEYSEVILAKWGVIAVAAVLAALLSFSVARRSNTPVYLLTVVPPVSVIFYFEIINGSLGFALIASSIAGFLSMRMVDSRYGGGAERKQQKRRERDARRLARFEEREKIKIEKLKAKSAASKIYDMAISSGLSSNRAKEAARAVEYIGRDERRIARVRARIEKREAARAAREAAREERKAERENARLEKQHEKEVRAGLTKFELFRIKNEKKTEKFRLRCKKLEAKRKTRCNHAAGGYAASAAAVVALIALAVPFIFLKTPFPKIPFLKTGLDAITAFATDLFVGDGVDLTSNPYDAVERFKYERIDFSPRSYKGITIFHVEAPTQRTVYLKSRTALDFDINRDTWSYADGDEIIGFVRRFGKGFTPDRITTNAYSYLFPASGNVPLTHGTLNYERFGFSVEQVHVKRMAGRSGILLLPYLAGIDHGVLNYGSTEPASKKVTPFFDGIYTSRYFKAGESGYSTLSYVYNMTRRDLGAAFETVASELDYVYSLALRWKNGEDADLILDDYYDEAFDLGHVSGFGERYLTSMTRSEKNAFIEDYETELKYREYAAETYARPSGSAKIKALSDEIMAGASEDGAVPSRYDMVMAVIDYLTEGYDYSLEPPAPEGEGSAVEAFLFETKCGYCSHYATSACLLLRDAGIPVRYVEGYHVSGLYAAPGGSADQYGANVLDSDSHTWIEVYFDSIGWVPFETTVTFTEYVETSTDPVGELEPDPWEEVERPDKDKNKNDRDDVKKPDRDKQEQSGVTVSFWDRFGTAIVTILSVAALASLSVLTVKIIIKRAKKALVMRARKIKSIKDGKRYDLGFADRHEDAKYLIDSAFAVLAAADLRPAKGEQLSEFASRLETEYKGITKQDLAEVMRCVLKEEYGHGLTQEELVTLALFLEDVIFAVYLGMTGFERIKYRYLLRII